MDSHEIMVRDEQPSREATACQGGMMFAIKAEVNDSWAETFAFSAQKTMYAGKHIAKGDTIFVFANENEGGPSLIRERRRHLSQSDRKKTRDRPANAAGERHHQAHCAGKAAPGAERAQAFFRLERRSTRDRAQLQILSPGNEQDRRHLEQSGGVPRRILLTRPISSNGVRWLEYVKSGFSEFPSRLS